MSSSTTDKTIIDPYLSDNLNDIFSAMLTFDNDKIYNTIKLITNMLKENETNNKTRNITLYESFYYIEDKTPIYYIYNDLLYNFYENILFVIPHTDEQYNNFNNNMFDLIKLFISHDYYIIKTYKQLYIIAYKIYDFLYYTVGDHHETDIYIKYISLLIVSLVDSIKHYDLNIYNDKINKPSDINEYNRMIVELIIDADDDILNELNRNKKEMITTLLNHKYNFDIETNMPECWTSLNEAIMFNVNYETIITFLDHVSLSTILQETASEENVFQEMERFKYKDTEQLTEYIKQKIDDNK